MPQYRLTEKKAEEYLGVNLLFFLNPLKEKNFLLASLGIIASALIIALFLIPFHYYLISGIVVLIGFALLPAAYLVRSDINLHLAAGKIKRLVNDPHLLWLNKQPPENITTKFGRSEKGSLPPATFRLLAYLKKEESAQGMHQRIKSMKNSGSARQTLNRLADKKIFSEPLLKRENNDFRYAPWQFIVVNKYNRRINSREAEKMEKVINRIWEKMLEDTY